MYKGVGECKGDWVGDKGGWAAILGYTFHSVKISIAVSLIPYGGKLWW